MNEKLNNASGANLTTKVLDRSVFSLKKKHLDLFSGIGGFAIAAQAAGFETIGFSEIEPFACQVLKNRWPEVPNYGDIRELKNVRADLITGGFPCQPFSVAGKRRGAADDRHLWPEMLRIFDEGRPSWVLCENVAGITKMELDNCLSDLEELNYSAWPIIIPACAVDARHRRNRVWIVAHAQGKQSTSHKSASDKPNQSERVSCEFGGSCGIELLRDANVKLGCSGDGSRKNAETARKPSTDSRDNSARVAEWLPEPGVGRVAHGIPNRAHRLRGLGNAIVPQIAEQILKAVLEIETRPWAS